MCNHRSKRQHHYCGTTMLQVNGHSIIFKTHGGRSQMEFTQFNGSAFLSPKRPASGDHDEDGSSSSNVEASTADAADVLVLSGSTFNDVSNPKRRHGESSSLRRSPRTRITKKENPTAAVSTERRQSLISYNAGSIHIHSLYDHFSAKSPTERLVHLTDKCKPSYAVLQGAALAHVRIRWCKFENVSAPNFRPDELLSLVVKTVRVEVDGQMCAFATANGDSVFAYSREQGEPPKFELDVGHPWKNAPPPQP
ncbi:hypothetical protein CABS01_16659 [Colletotrichum abscissum]|uniref:uncharacterized protein n=1 Tax=Colletotrichum abscissum TaxID=1671311 RepID=UPI0027D70370|nr:uncharacterized protein CABS01_16659 [Colletotrichum abscissum]KAK1517392.1 hypothetical protein CABS01_16659 [Colletotrichum abscissum]